MDNVSNSKTNRLDYIDLFRGIGILLMIMGHVGFGGMFDKFIHAFHMPMFFYVSGYFYKSSNNNSFQYLKKKAKSLLVPYFWFAFIHYAIYFISIKSIDVNRFKSLVFNSVEPVPIAGALWFLTALFLTEIIYMILDKIKNRLILHLLVAGITIIGMLFGCVIPFRLPFSLDAAMVGVGFYHFARVSRNSNFFINVLKIYQMKIGQVIIVSALLIVAIFVNGYVNMRTGEYAYFFITYIVAVVSSIVGFNLCRIVQQKTSNHFFVELLTVVRSVGKHSIVYVCLNQIVIKFVHYLFVCIKAGSPIFHIFEFVFVTILLYIFSVMFTQTRLCSLCGRKLEKLNRQNQ